ncbi:MAG: hypothetical protein K5695_02330 [Oscillospiraceae bacterium]|nr:hypothetical protein [Oscillospiraceae bacterium]
MKKLTALLLACCVVLCGCSKKAPAPESTPAPTETTETTTAAVTETAAETTEAPTEPPAQDTETAYWHHPDLSLEEALSCYLHPDTVGQYYSMRLPSLAEDAWLYETSAFDADLFSDIFEENLPQDHRDEIQSYSKEQFGKDMSELLQEDKSTETYEMVKQWAQSVDPHTLTDWQYLIYYEVYVDRSAEAARLEAARLREMPVQELSAGDLYGLISRLDWVYTDIEQLDVLEITLPITQRCREFLAQPYYAEKLPEHLAEHGIGSSADAALPQTWELDASNTAEWYATYAASVKEFLDKYPSGTDSYVPDTLEPVAAKLLMNSDPYYLADYPSWREMPDDLPYLPEVTEVRYLIVDRQEDGDPLPKLLQNEELFACYVPGDGWLFHLYNANYDDYLDPVSNGEKRTARELLQCARNALAELGADKKPGCYSSEPECSVNPDADFDNALFEKKLRAEFPELDNYRYVIVVNKDSAHAAIQRKDTELTPCIGLARYMAGSNTYYGENCTDASFLLATPDNYGNTPLAHALDFEAVSDILMDNYGLLF